MKATQTHASSRIRASSRARLNQIWHLVVEGVTLVAHDNELTVPTAYYSSILSSEVTMTWSFILCHLYATSEHTKEAPLTKLFTERESYHVVHFMNMDITPSPDGIRPSFYFVA